MYILYNNKKMDSNIIVIVAITASLVLLVASEPLYREALFNASIPIIVGFQSKATPTSIAVSKAISDVGVFGLILAIIVGSYVWLERERCFYYLSLFTGIMFVTNWGKILYHSPRPYMVSDEV